MTSMRIFLIILLLALGNLSRANAMSFSFPENRGLKVEVAAQVIEVKEQFHGLDYFVFLEEGATLSVEVISKDTENLDKFLISFEKEYLFKKLEWMKKRDLEFVDHTPLAGAGFDEANVHYTGVSFIQGERKLYEFSYFISCKDWLFEVKMLRSNHRQIENVSCL